MEQRLSFVTLGVGDLERAQAFYDALGWSRSSYGEGLGVAFYQLNGIVFALYPRADLARDAGLDEAGWGGFGAMSLSYNTRTRDEVDAVMAQAKAAGARILKPPFEIFWGGYLGYFADPDGHLWEVVYNPKAQIGPAGEATIPL